MRHKFIEVNLLLTIKDKIRLCKAIQIIKTKTINNSKDILQQYGRYKFSIIAFPAIIDNLIIVRSSQLSKTKTLNNSEEVST